MRKTSSRKPIATKSYSFDPNTYGYSPFPYEVFESKYIKNSETKNIANIMAEKITKSKSFRICFFDKSEPYGINIDDSVGTEDTLCSMKLMKKFIAALNEIDYKQFGENLNAAIDASRIFIVEHFPGIHVDLIDVIMITYVVDRFFEVIESSEHEVGSMKSDDKEKENEEEEYYDEEEEYYDEEEEEVIIPMKRPEWKLVYVHKV